MPDITIGSSLVDMHGSSLSALMRGLESMDQTGFTAKWDVIEGVDFEAYHFATWIQAHLNDACSVPPMVTNKRLYVIGDDEDGNLVVAYATDGIRAGLGKVRPRNQAPE